MPTSLHAVGAIMMFLGAIAGGQRLMPVTGKNVHWSEWSLMPVMKHVHWLECSVMPETKKAAGYCPYNRHGVSP